MRALKKVFVALAVFVRIGEVYVVTAAELSRLKPAEQDAKTSMLSVQDPGFGKDRKEGHSLKDAAISFQDGGVYTNYAPRMQQEREEEEAISGVVDSQQEKEEARLLAKGGNFVFNQYKKEPARPALLKNQNGKLRGSVDGVVDTDTGGSEFGGSCKSDAACYSGSCGAGNKCGCPEESNCLGCSSNTAACVRLEQTHPSKQLEVCKLQAYYVDTINRPYKMFSAGAAHTNDYGNLPFLIRADAATKCVVVNPTGEEGNLLLPAFVQSNVATTNMDEISRIRLFGPDDSVLDSVLFANGNWVKTIDLSDKSTQGQSGVYVDYWPREMVTDLTDLQSKISNANYQGKTLVLAMSAETIVIDFDFPPGFGVEIISEGPESNGTVVVGSFEKSVIKTEGRLSFKNLVLSFEEGTLDVQGSTIFQNCTLTDLSRCPGGFRRVGGQCVYLNPIGDQADDIEQTCAEIGGRVFLPMFNDLIDPAEIAQDLLGSGRQARIGNTTALCETIDSAGNLIETSIFDECEEFIPVLCVATTKDPFSGNNYT
eukprot:scaffold20853_cov56-Attheya_sp.AAC.3